MTFKIGDYVEVIYAKQHPEHVGKRGVIIEFKERSVRYNGSLYPGWKLSPPIINFARNNISWEAHQIRKIDPPDWEVENREEKCQTEV